MATELESLGGMSAYAFRKNSGGDRNSELWHILETTKKQHRYRRQLTGVYRERDSQ